MITAAAAVLATCGVLGMAPPAVQASSAGTLYAGYTVIKSSNPLQISGAIVPVNTATNRAGRPIRMSGGVGDIAFTPDGKTAYVASSGINDLPGKVTPISTATNTPGRPIRFQGAASGVAITPNGRTAYVSTADKIVPISTATNTAGKPIHINGGG